MYSLQDDVEAYKVNKLIPETNSRKELKMNRPSDNDKFLKALKIRINDSVSPDSYRV